METRLPPTVHPTVGMSAHGAAEAPVPVPFTGPGDDGRQKWSKAMLQSPFCHHNALAFVSRAKVGFNYCQLFHAKMLFSKM